MWNSPCYDYVLFLSLDFSWRVRWWTSVGTFWTHFDKRDHRTRSFFIWLRHILKNVHQVGCKLKNGKLVALVFWGFSIMCYFDDCYWPLLAMHKIDLWCVAPVCFMHWRPMYFWGQFCTTLIIIYLEQFK